MNCLNVDLLPVCTSRCFVCLVSVWWVNGLHQVNMSATVASQFLWRVRCVLSWYHNSWIPWNFSNNPNSDDIWDLLFNQPQFTINNFISLMCRWILTPSGNMKQSRRKFLSSLRHPTSNIGNICVTSCYSCRVIQTAGCSIIMLLLNWLFYFLVTYYLGYVIHM